MKTMQPKEILTIVLIVAAGIYFSMNKKTNHEPNKVTITGKVSNPIGDKVYFDNSIAPTLGDTIASATLNKDGTFAVSFNLDSASYLKFAHGIEVTLMYVKPGDKINLTIDTELFDETIKYHGSEHSSYLAKRYLIDEGKDFYGKFYYMSSVEEYKEMLDSYKIEMLNILTEISDSTFVNSEIINLEENIKNISERQKKLSEENTVEARSYMWESREINRAFNFYTALDSLNSDDFNTMTSKYTLSCESVLKKVTDKEFVEKTRKIIRKTVESWKERKKAVDNMPKEGESAIDFTYPDLDGNEFSLASFKGNLIYVDVWATWCGPCKAEIPSLQRLEADYHEKNITFMSVSVDTDEEAWKKMIEEKKLGGIQLWADGWSEITRDYAIFGIPRFLLFDSEGNVISTNAPRPSSKEIRVLLDSNLE